MEAPTPFHAQELYDSTGRHVGGLYPPIAQGNVLTSAYTEQTAPRPSCCWVGCDFDRDNLALVWMAPLGLTAAGPISNEVIGALVAAIDDGKGVMVHAETDEMAVGLGELVLMFKGGGRA